MLRRSVVKILLPSLTVSITLIAADQAFANQTAVAKRLRKYDVLKLDAKSAASQIRRTGTFALKTSQQVLDSIAGNFTSKVTLIGPTGRILLMGVRAEFFHTRIPGGKGMLKLGLAGQYVIEVTAGAPGVFGRYTLRLLNDAPPTLLAEERSDNAIALQSVSMLRGPFPLTTPFNLSLDQQTRIMLIADNLAVLPGENQSAVTAIAEDSQLNTYPLTVEFFGKVPGFGRLTQIVAKLPSNLPSGQELQVKVTVRGKTSNKVKFRIKSP